ncbi:MAG: nucleotidyltransferase family protein [Leadbetterella sp.]
MHIGLVILAAGSSKRMGYAKQNLKIDHRTMLQHIIHQGLMSDLSPVTVVLGDHKKDIVRSLDSLPITIIDNPNFASGMGSSIKMGLVGTYMSNKSIDGVIYITSDMPLIKTSHLEKMVGLAKENPDKQIIAAQYADTIGIPVLFRRSLFESVLDIEPEAGAKSIINENIVSTLTFDFPEGVWDLDTPVDVDRFMTYFPEYF